MREKECEMGLLWENETKGKIERGKWGKAVGEYMTEREERGRGATRSR